MSLSLVPLSSNHILTPYQMFEEHIGPVAKRQHLLGSPLLLLRGWQAYFLQAEIFDSVSFRHALDNPARQRLQAV